MAIKTDDLTGDLAIELDADDVTATEFHSALEAFLNLVREVTRQYNEGSQRDCWRLNVQRGSQVISLRADNSRISAAAATGIYSAMLDGLDALESEAKIPKYFTESALESARKLSQIAFGKRDAGVPVRILSKTRSRVFTRSTFNHVSEILDWKYEDLGSVEGRLEAVSAHNGYEFKIYEPIWARAIRCTFSDDELLREALGVFKKRVEVQGLIRYTKDGLPVSVKAVKIAEFPDQKALPSYRDVIGIMSS